MKKLKILLLFFVIVIVTAFFLRGKIVHEKFDSKVWKTTNLNSEINLSLRWDMMNDLRKKQNLVGMTKSEIMNLLGNPETESNSEFSYYLGYSKSGINTGSLIITFNDSDIVTDFRVRQG